MSEILFVVIVALVAVAAQPQKAQLETFFAQMEKLACASDQKLNAIKAAVEAELKNAQDNAAKQLEQIRTGVDAKLQGVEKRLGESFQLFGARLEQLERELRSRNQTETVG